MVTGTSDVLVIGGGIVGLATGRALLRHHPEWKIVVLEKERTVAAHQSGHNSGVIHTGIYYAPGSSKAVLCVRGRAMLLDYLQQHSIPFRICGKLILATQLHELPALRRLEERARSNGIPGCRRLEAKDIRSIEPDAGGIAGLEVPGTGMVDYREVSRAYAKDIENGGADVVTSSRLEALGVDGSGVRARTSTGEYRARFLVNCAGLGSDLVARMAGVPTATLILPFRGEYYRLGREGALRGSRHIYPVPDPRFPFLGVHITRKMDGTLELGPNAVLAFRREGYSLWDWSSREMMMALTFPGFYPMALHMWRTASYEYLRSFSRAQFAEDLRRLIPALSEKDLRPGGSGVRAQALNKKGELVDDFVFERGPRSLHVLNAPSPAATASLAIAEVIADQIPSQL
jgi:L-2-hydroxyglutarate oxidase LhgO